VSLVARTRLSDCTIAVPLIWHNRWWLARQRPTRKRSLSRRDAKLDS